MNADITAGSTAIGAPPPLSGGAEVAFPRLVTTDTGQSASRSSWHGVLGNTLLETPWLVWSAFDAAVVSLGVYLAYRTHVWTPEGAWIEFPLWQTCLIFSLSLILSGLVFGLYEQQTLLRRSRIAARSLLSTALAIVLSYVVISLFMYCVQSRMVLFLAAVFYLLFAFPIRLAVCGTIPTYSRRFLIVGTDRKSRLSPPSYGSGLSRRYHLVGYVAMDPVEVGRRFGDHRVLGTIDEIERLCVEHDIKEVVVGPGPARNPRALDSMLHCLRLGCRVTNLSTFYEQVLSEVPLDHLEPNWFLFADLKHYREAQMIMKRAGDIVGASLGLLLTLPFWPIIALAIKLTSPGPVFYNQSRVGRNGEIFKLHKFRTMYMDSERAGHSWAAEDDPRITRVGWYLRRSRLDELPQLWNILLGQMSIIGPRPERPEFVGELAEKIQFYNERHLVKPGLSGWAQINYHYGASIEDARRKLQLDLWYIKHMSVELDLAIVLRTMGTMFLGSR